MRRGSQRSLVCGLLLAMVTVGCGVRDQDADRSPTGSATTPVRLPDSARTTAVVSTIPVATAVPRTAPESTRRAGAEPGPVAGKPSTSRRSRGAPSSAAASSLAAPGQRTRSPAAFRSTISRIDAELAQRMTVSHREGCPVPLSGLRYLTVSYRGFDGGSHTGELVVSARVAADVVEVFADLYAAGFPIRRMQLVDEFGGDDDRSMAADNTSAFNCRPVTGGGGWSEHSYGEAIDLNPRENPYMSGSTVLPPAGTAFLDRPDRPGVIHADGPAVAAFGRIGWTWGGTWSDPVDLQHFSLSGR